MPPHALYTLQTVAPDSTSTSNCVWGGGGGGVKLAFWPLILFFDSLRHDQSATLEMVQQYSCYTSQI